MTSDFQFTEPRTLYVLGQKFTMLPGDGTYVVLDMVVEPFADGPPPHLHLDLTEFFYVIEGRMEIVADGRTISLEPGRGVHAPREAVHTFRNPHADPARMIVIANPGNLLARFFVEVGIDAAEPDAKARSLAPETARFVIENSETWGMRFFIEPAAR